MAIAFTLKTDVLSQKAINKMSEQGDLFDDPIDEDEANLYTVEYKAEDKVDVDTFLTNNFCGISLVHNNETHTSFLIDEA